MMDEDNVGADRGGGGGELQQGWKASKGVNITSMVANETRTSAALGHLGEGWLLGRNISRRLMTSRMGGGAEDVVADSPLRRRRMAPEDAAALRTTVRALKRGGDTDSPL
ncbi:uncharacterized protein A4U43_C07F630 [Asparagus officinalis]|uniref:Uncharacterized protein n=1 Tax=Asparagus officinalis TaxID=4686 RepID=A0A5P1EA88_ASPOF|nr:uncharacterized protein A4U43_C07F630 [Asparagus officinalis]